MREKIGKRWKDKGDVGARRLLHWWKREFEGCSLKKKKKKNGAEEEFILREKGENGEPLAIRFEWLK